MSALTHERPRTFERWTRRSFTLTSGTVAYKGGMACLNTATGLVVPGTTSATLIWIGYFARTVDATSGALPVDVDLTTEIYVTWFDNSASATADRCTTGNVGSMCYILDDQSVTMQASGASVAGRVWAVDSTQGVAVEKKAVTAS
jgi:hypothetical protein